MLHSALSSSRRNYFFQLLLEQALSVWSNRFVGNGTFPSGFPGQESQNAAHCSQSSWSEEQPQESPSTWDTAACVGSKVTSHSIKLICFNSQWMCAWQLMTVFCPSHIVTSSGVLLINDPKLEDFQFILDTKTASNLHISEQQPCFLAMSFQKKTPKLCRSIYQRFIAALLWGDADEMTSCRQHIFSLLFPLMWCGENIIMQFYLEWFTISKNDRFCIRVLMFYQKKEKSNFFVFATSEEQDWLY